MIHKHLHINLAKIFVRNSSSAFLSLSFSLRMKLILLVTLVGTTLGVRPLRPPEPRDLDLDLEEEIEGKDKPLVDGSNGYPE